MLPHSMLLTNDSVSIILAKFYTYTFVKVIVLYDKKEKFISIKKRSERLISAQARVTLNETVNIRARTNKY